MSHESDDGLTSILLENGDIMAAQVAEIDRLKAQLEASEARFDDVWNHGKDVEGLLVTARNQLADARNQLVTAKEIITDFSNLYSYAWDRADGGLMMMERGVERFEVAHERAFVFQQGTQ